MLCVVAAMYSEIEFLLKAVSVKSEQKLPGGRTVFVVCHNGSDFIIAVCGIGKVNSAVTLQYILDNFDADAVINIGTAGGIKGGFKKNDVLIASAAYQHDYDIGLGGGDYKRGEIPGISRDAFVFDGELRRELLGICAALGFSPREGAVVSGDRFIADRKKAEELAEVFGACVCEMEAAALLQTAALNGFKRIAAVKSVSDNADGDAARDIADITGAKERIRDIIIAYLNKKIA
ncbi:MAG: 5'-methylthioadenosine/S-adenosylhomocysteine nucleosidase [Clostridiales bacterium]|jgi:adenosylhomocysteine nucleosidase|nr:5'-methylthioadenosine/S-adenosylhomocysteine nucleosidase [Clostridiales bacterium]